MNEFAATGLIYAMAKGKSIIAIVDDPRASLDLVAASDLLPAHPGVKVTRSAGRECLAIAGSTLHFFSPRQQHALRGRSAHIVFIDAPLDRVKPELLRDAHLVTCAVAGGRVIRA